MGVRKGTNGYIRKKKRWQLLMTVVIAALSVGLFLLGWFAVGTTKNLLTVVAVLGALPAAKALVGYIMFLPYKSFDENEFAVLRLAGEKNEPGHIYSDLVFTSPQSVMHLDALYVVGKELVGLKLADEKKKKQGEIVSYFTDSLKKRGVTVHMHIFKTPAEMLERIESLSDRNEEIPEEITEFIRMILA